MLCQGSIQENNSSRPCWLPSQPNSLQLCRRCHFQRITHILDSLTRDYGNAILHPSFELLLNDKTFLQDLIHPAREQALLNLLSALFRQNKIQFERVVRHLRLHTLFPILITKRIQQHTPGTRCEMYRTFLKDSTLYTSPTLCWNCWSCIAWVLKQGNSRLLEMYTNTFGYYFSRLNHETFVATGPRVFLDLFVSLHWLQKDHHIRVLIQHMFHTFPLEDVKAFLLAFLQQPFLLHLYAEKKEKEFLPLPLQDDVVVKELRNQIKQSIKQRTNIYKEELVMVTWHPKRLFPWCLDIEEWKDMGVSSSNCCDVYNSIH